MKHYGIDEWKEFKENNLSMDLINEMQIHLLECDDCMNLYLESIDDDYIRDVSKDLPDDFTECVTNKIKLEDSRIITAKKKNYISNIMICYISAACITLFLMSQGFFHTLTSNVPYASSILKNNTLKSEKFLTSGWTDHLTRNTSLFLNGLLNNNRRDSFEK
jgi:hypothetical protein